MPAPGSTVVAVRDGRTLVPSRRATMPVTRSATPRALEVLGAQHRERALGAVAGVIVDVGDHPQIRRALLAPSPPARARGARAGRRRGVRRSAGNDELASAMSASTSAPDTPVSPGWANVLDWLVPTSARPRHGTSVSIRPCARRRGERDVARRLRRQQAHHFDERVLALDAERLHHDAGVRAGGVDRGAGANRQLAAGRHVAHFHAADAAALA